MFIYYKLTLEVNPVKLLDTIIILNSEGVVSTQVYQKESKQAVPWVFKSRKGYKLNTISADLHRSRKIESNLISKSEQSKQNTSKLDIHGDLSKISFEILLHL